jgi:16S rRNA C967 or C1407 C5-methylase (RsmB/RsmF family)
VLAAVALGVEKDENVLDLCSSPGGKALTILQTLNPSNHL